MPVDGDDPLVVAPGHRDRAATCSSRVRTASSRSSWRGQSSLAPVRNGSPGAVRAGHRTGATTQGLLLATLQAALQDVAGQRDDVEGVHHRDLLGQRLGAGVPAYAPAGPAPAVRTGLIGPVTWHPTTARWSSSCCPTTSGRACAAMQNAARSRCKNVAASRSRPRPRYRNLRPSGTSTLKPAATRGRPSFVNWTAPAVSALLTLEFSYALGVLLLCQNVKESPVLAGSILE